MPPLTADKYAAERERLGGTMELQENDCAQDGPAGAIALRRPGKGNLFTPRTCHEIRDRIDDGRNRPALAARAAPTNQPRRPT